MSRRQPVPVPHVWLMTDERMGDSLWAAVRRLPAGAGVVFRHYDTADRIPIWRRLRRETLRRGIVLLSAREPLPGCDGVHNGHMAGGLATRSVHDARERRLAIRRRAAAVFVSPVYPTRSHPASPTLGSRGLIRLTLGLPMPAIALGGMNPRRFRQVGHIAHGWAAIDAWSGSRGTGGRRLNRPAD